MAVFAEAALSIPATAHELMEFRLWAQTEDFPEQGRIDFLQGGLEIDMSPEDLYTHGTTKLEISTRLQLLVTDRDIGVATRHALHAGATGCSQDRGHAVALGDLPSERMFAPTRTYDEYVHWG